MNNKNTEKEIAFIMLEMKDKIERKNRAKDLFENFYDMWEKEVSPDRELQYLLRNTYNIKEWDNEKES